jgi:predicted outer membrane protein
MFSYERDLTMKRMFVPGLSLALLVCGISTVSAQNVAGQQAGQFGQQQQQTGQQQPQVTLADQQIAACLLVGNQGEIALAQLAEQKAKHKDVKEAAKQMVEDHTKLVHELNRWAGRWANNQQAGAGQVPQVQTGQFQNGQPMADQGLDFVAIHQQIGQQCLESAKREFNEKQGDEFDKCYIGQQIGAHMHMLDTLKVVRQHASPQFAQVLAQGEQTTQKHLDHLKHIMKELESSNHKS